MSQTQIQIVHESEAQRQHVRLRIPCRVEILGRTYNVADLSSGGFAADDFSTDDLPQQPFFPVLLAVPFQDFTLDLNLKAEIQQHDEAMQVLRCRFTDISAAQLSVLNHIIKAFIAGDVLNVGDVLAIASRDNFVKARQNKTQETESFWFKLRRFFGLTFLFILGIAAFLFVSFNLARPFLWLQTSEARVVSEVIEVRAPVTGVFSASLAPQALKLQKNDVIGTINTTPLTLVTSPCDCFIQTNFSSAYVTFKTAGEVLLTLTPVQSSAVIQADFSMQDIQKIDVGDKATAQIAGTNYILEASVSKVSVAPTARADGFGFKGVATLKTNRLLPSDLSNQPVRVSIRI